MAKPTRSLEKGIWMALNGLYFLWQFPSCYMSLLVSYQAQSQSPSISTRRHQTEHLLVSRFVGGHGIQISEGRWSHQAPSTYGAWLGTNHVVTSWSTICHVCSMVCTCCRCAHVGPKLHANHGSILNVLPYYCSSGLCMVCAWLCPSVATAAWQGWVSHLGSRTSRNVSG